jgi:hypothetical protein
MVATTIIHMNTQPLAAALLALAASVWVCPISAQDWDRSRMTDGVIYVSGGIGSASRDELALREKDFNLKLVSTITGTGTYVADVDLTITDNAGKIVARHTTQGPLFMAKLPEGAYTASATFRDQTQTRKFQVRANRLHTEYLRWTARPDEDWTLPWGTP